MKIYNFIIATLLLFTLSCKKDKLTGENKLLIGKWNSTSTTFGCGIVAGTPYNPNLTIDLYEKGKYKLYEGSQKIETGRLIIENTLVMFICREKNSKLNGKTILNFTSTTMNIDRNACDDDYLFRFVKN
jgi:hypothetical protein